MSLDRLNIAFDTVLATVYQEGFIAGMEHINNDLKETKKAKL